MTDKEKRRLLAIMHECRRWLYFKGMITEKENDKINQRIGKWQDKNLVSITDEQLLSVNMTYNDNAK